MKRYILTGTPGAGKTTLINAIEKQHFFIVRESFMDTYANIKDAGVEKPLETPNFIDHLLQMQIEREKKAKSSPNEIQFFDRSPICTLALSQFMGLQPSKFLTTQIKEMLDKNLYSKHVFFIENLGFCNSDEIRTLTYAQALEFEKLHLELYQKYNFKCISIPKMTVEKRVALLLKKVKELH